jgi:hypothetical protein
MVGSPKTSMMAVGNDWPIVGCGIVSIAIDVSLNNGSVVLENSCVVLVLLIIGCLAKISPRNANTFCPLDEGCHGTGKRDGAQ